MFIEEYPGRVSPELCEEIVARFEAEPRQHASVVGGGGVSEARPELRTGTMLSAAPHKSPDWKALVKRVSPAFQETLKLYAAKYTGLRMVMEGEGLALTIPLIERVEPGQGFKWHYDQSAQFWQRVLAGLLYLRTVDDGGQTEFADQQCKIQPVAGKILLFPPYWTHVHRGVTPGSGTKYVMSYFWIYAKAATAAPAQS
jgi:hypothetical protein